VQHVSPSVYVSLSQSLVEAVVSKKLALGTAGDSLGSPCHTLRKDTAASVAAIFWLRVPLYIPLNSCRAPDVSAS
jgi:hypothetical protein